jgi:protein-S-isoprenylcysteine O-methyltransferase Ste14
MPAEDPFRVALVVVVLVTMSIAVPYRLRAAASGETISHQAEGYVFATILRLMGLAMWLATLSWLISPAAVWWALMPLPLWVRWTGVAIGACCPLLMYWTLSSLGKNLTDTVVTRREATLVTHGPYRWVRHPFYVTAAILMAAVTLLSANWLIGACGVVVLTMLAIRTPKEERMLVARFGAEYEDYMARTGRFFPRLTRR